MKKTKIPKRLQSVLWSVNIDGLDIKKNKSYIIHQILIYGTLIDLKWLLSVYPKKEVINIFLKQPYKSYPGYVYEFVKNYVLDLKQKNIDENAYVTSIFQPLRSRATENFSKT